MTLVEQALLRLGEEPGTEHAARIQALCDLASIRIALRVREPTLPNLLLPIAADVVVKLWRRGNYEGISSENGEGITTSFVENVLAEYEDDFAGYLDAKAETAGRKVVRFL